MKKKLIFAICCFIALFTLITPHIHAEETTDNTPVTEKVETGSYQYVEDNKNVIFTLYDDGSCSIVGYDSKTNETLSFVANYSIKNGVLYVDLNGDITAFNISGNVLSEVKNDLSTMWKDFSDTWLSKILTMVFSAVGSGFIIAIASQLIKKMTARVTSGVIENAEERKKTLEDIKKLQDLQNEFTEKQKATLEELKNALPTLKEDMAETLKKYTDMVDFTNSKLEILSQLVGMLVASNPTLANSEYATMILELLGTQEKAGDEDEQNV